jgi:sensor c-di-GMP phosphodiesterase-like protein
MRVVAEGIDDEIQARKLHELSCDMGRRWLYARALSAHAPRDWLRARALKGGKVMPVRRVAV